MKNIKIKLDKGKISLPLNQAQGGIRIADEHGNHVSAPTKIKNEPKYFVEWMITNDENKLIADSFFNSKTLEDLIEEMETIEKFAEESEYSQRKTVKLEKEKKENFAGFEIFHYTEGFSSFEKTLSSGLRVRITFKLGDYGLEPHPHMYVLIPFNSQSLRIKNEEGDVNSGEILGRGCFAEWVPTSQDLQEIMLTLAHASDNHRKSLIDVLKS